MNNPTFSVIIPTYNRADFIVSTIESVMRQTFTDFEIIVVDDGSTDDTREIVSALNYPQLSYRYQQNAERAVARNAGVELAKGKYVTFFDSDDLLYENHLAVALELIENYKEPEFFHLGYDFKYSTGTIYQEISPLPETANEKLISGNCFSCNGVFLRADVIQRHFFNPDRNLAGTEDYELWLRLASRYPLYCDNRVTSTIIQHDDRSVVTTNREKLIERIHLLEKYLFEDSEFIKKYANRIPQFRANNRIYIALHLALAKQPRSETLKFLLQALRFSPLQSLRNRAFYGTLKRLFL